MSKPYAGGCACGAIRYTCTVEPVFSWNCHCRDCQRASGGGYCPVMYVPSTGLKMTGAPTYYAVAAESGNRVERGFCASCGSPICLRAELVPALTGLWAGSLDQPSRFMPQLDVWTASAAAWDTMQEGLPKVRHAPTAAQLQKLLD